MNDVDNSSVKCWGTINYGQLGYGHSNKTVDDANEMVLNVEKKKVL